MKKSQQSTLLYALAAGALAYILLRKPATRAAYSLATGPKYHKAIEAVLKSGDPQQIAKLRLQYDKMSPAMKDSFDTTIRHLGLKRPW